MMAPNRATAVKNPKNSPLWEAGARFEYRLRLRAWLPPCTMATAQARNQNSMTVSRK